ncbi:MAG: hypothetical protein LBN02_05090 [Oscillospiraceae bacterium]|nr:hypothetical protein [Oscillospiraceae bacterium]
MNNSKIKRGIFGLLLCAGLLAAVLVPLGIADAESPSTTAVNENGQTYGSGHVNDPSNPDIPDLIFALGVDGTDGYVYKTDLYGTGPLVKPTNLEEAVAYMAQLDALAEQAKARNDEYLYYIPLYASDGVTVIGQFGINLPSEELN